MSEWIPLADSKTLPDIVAVYVIRHTASGKEYVGKSLVLANRMRQHRRASSPYYLHRAIREHGLEAFEVAVVFTGTAAEVGAYETAEIERRGTFAPAGYNMTIGGDGGNFVEWTAERRQAARERATGRRASDETKAKMRASAAPGMGWEMTPAIRDKIRLTLKGMKRKPPSEETKRKIAASNKGKLRPWSAGGGNSMYGKSRGLAPRARAVAVWEVGSMTPIIFDCVADAADFYEVVSPQISVWAAGKTRPKSGRVFAYLD